MLRSLHQVYGTKKVRGYNIIDVPPFFESADREDLSDPSRSDTGHEGSSPTQGEDDSTIFWGDNQGPVVMVWEGMFPGEQESVKKIIVVKMTGSSRGSNPREVNRERGLGEIGIVRRPLTF